MTTATASTTAIRPSTSRAPSSAPRPNGFFRNASAFLRDNPTLISRLNTAFRPIGHLLETSEEAVAPFALACMIPAIAWFIWWSIYQGMHRRPEPVPFFPPFEGGFSGGQVWEAVDFVTRGMAEGVLFLVRQPFCLVVMAALRACLWYVTWTPIIALALLALLVCENLSAGLLLPFLPSPLIRLVDYLALSFTAHHLTSYIAPTLLLSLHPYLHLFHLTSAAIALFNLAPLQYLLDILAMADEGTLFSNFKVLLSIERETVDVKAMREELKSLREEVAGLKGRSA